MFALVSMWHDLTFLQAAVGEEDLPNGTLILTHQASQTQNKSKPGLFPHLFLLERVKVSFCSGTDVSQPSWTDLVVEKTEFVLQRLMTPNMENKDSSHPVARGEENIAISLGIHFPIRKLKVSYHL